MMTVNKSKAVGRVKHSLMRARATLNVVPYNSNGKLTERLRVPVRPGGTLRVVGRKMASVVSCNGVGNASFFYAYKMNFSTFIDLGFTGTKGHNLLACLRGALRRDLACRPRACRLRARSNACGCGTFLVTYNGTSRCNGGTCVAPRTALASNLLSIAVLRPFAMLSIPSLTFRLFGGAVSRGDHVGAFHYEGLHVRHADPKMIRFSNSPVRTSRGIGVRLVRGKLHIVIPGRAVMGSGTGILRGTRRCIGKVGVVGRTVMSGVARGGRGVVQGLVQGSWRFICFYELLRGWEVLWGAGCVFEARAYKRLEVSSMGDRIALSK